MGSLDTTLQSRRVLPYLRVSRRAFEDGCCNVPATGGIHSNV
ncbi:hypothetical protein [Metallosphaera javensis (ex Sakai et al. 2022)]|nr:MAG: hypothetical protein MjAS7_1237 [Metallosphaera javensis (ex Sakai et al. 2022)]